MKNQYTINELATICKVSKQSIYNLIKKNKEFVNQNSKRNQRTIYYNQSVLDFLLDYYHLEDNAPSDKILYEKIGGGDHSPEAENSLVQTSSKDEPTESRITDYESQIATLKAEIDKLQQDLAAKEEERKELLKQNGALILALSQEKQEKMLLLPAPKKPFGERVKSLFHKENKA